MPENMVVNSRDEIMKELVRRGVFSFAGYIQNEVRATALVLFRNVAKYYGMPVDEVNRITKEFAGRLEEKEYTGWLQNAVESLGFDYEDHWDILDGMPIKFCYRFAKIPYNNSTAASGVIMINSNTDAQGDASKHVGMPAVPVRNRTVMYNGSDLESFGYIKYDLLTVTTMDAIQHFYGKRYNWNNVDDPKVWDTIASGDTDFVFQFASPGMKELLVKTNCRSIQALAECNALYRPGPIEGGFIEKYIAIKNGQDPNFSQEELALQAALKNVFGEQHLGLMIFQEDVMKICQECAGFTLAEADDIRRAMGKKKDEVMAVWHDPFVNGWNQHMPEGSGDPEKVWEALKNFAHYAFNKSHSVAYAIIAYATAKLWTYRRNDFLEYLMNDSNSKDNFNMAIAKIKQLEYPLDYPDVFHLGGTRYELEPLDPKDPQGRAVLHIPMPGVEDPETGEQRVYRSYVQFLFDPDVNNVALIYKGVCDSLHGDREALAELSSTLLVKMKRQAVYMEPEGVVYTNMDDILKGLLACGAVQSVENVPEGKRILVTRANGKEPNAVILHPNHSKSCRRMKLQYDMKYFGSARNGVLSNLPYVNHEGVARMLHTVRDRMLADGKSEADVYKWMRDKLSDHMYEYHRNRVFENVYAVLKDRKVFDRGSIKLTIEFADKTDIFYAPRALSEAALRVKIGSLVKMKMQYSPFVNKRRKEFVYDFDILEMEGVD